LTANAQTHDKDVCLEAGMDDYLAKPVTRAGFAAKLSRFRVSAPPVADAKSDVEPAAPGATVFDAAIFGELAETLGADDIRLVMETFLAESKKRFGEMRKAAKDDDNALIKREAHTIKSRPPRSAFCVCLVWPSRLRRKHSASNGPISMLGSAGSPRVSLKFRTSSRASCHSRSRLN
jgi:hypothetical protein